MINSVDEMCCQDKKAPEHNNPKFEGEFELDHSIERVWEALTDSELLTEWLFPNDMEPTERARFSFDVPPEEGLGSRIDCEVRHVEPFRSISYTWSISDNPKDGSEDGLVIFDLQVMPLDRTRLRIRHTTVSSTTTSIEASAAGLRGLLQRHTTKPTMYGRAVTALAA